MNTLPPSLTHVSNIYFLNKKFSLRLSTNNISKQFWNFTLFNLPYLGDVSSQIQKELQNFIIKHFPDSKLHFIHNTCKHNNANTKLVFCEWNTLHSQHIQHQFNIKDKQHLLMRSNIVYHLDCSYGSFYIGQTCTNLYERLQEHQTCCSSEVLNHLQAHKNHSIDFKNPQILTYSKDKYKLLILELLYIQLLKPDLNINSVSFSLWIFNAWPSSSYSILWS